MVYFIYGQDSYRSKRKLEEIILGYKKVHKSGLNLIYVDAKQTGFDDFYNNFKINSMFAEKKLIVLKNVFDSKEFQENFLESIESMENLKDIVVVYENCPADKRVKIFKALEKYCKCQEFECLNPVNLKKWAAAEFVKAGARIDDDALDLLINFVGIDLWQMENEINKLSNYKAGNVIKKEEVQLLVKPNISNDIFKTIEALASKNKKVALDLLHKQLDGGDFPLYLLTMITYQFKNLLILKESPKNSGLHPFVIQKSLYLCNQFTIEELKKIYRKIFQIDLDIKTGKIEAETALDLFVYEFC